MSNVIERISAYLADGDLFNPELTNHNAVRNLLMAAHTELAAGNEWIQARASVMEELALVKAELAAAHRLLDAARYELRFEGSADLLDRIDAALGGGDD